MPLESMLSRRLDSISVKSVGIRNRVVIAIIVAATRMMFRLRRTLATKAAQLTKRHEENNGLRIFRLDR